jgi:hypothetical protein
MVIPGTPTGAWGVNASVAFARFKNFYWNEAQSQYAILPYGPISNAVTIPVPSQCRRHEIHVQHWMRPFGAYDAYLYSQYGFGWFDLWDEQLAVPPNISAQRYWLYSTLRGLRDGRPAWYARHDYGRTGALKATRFPQQENSGMFEPNYTDSIQQDYHHSSGGITALGRFESFVFDVIDFYWYPVLDLAFTIYSYDS